MDAFAITGVRPEHDRFRVQAAVGCVEFPARLFPRIHVLRSADIADLASGGRTIYFQQQGGLETSLVPFASEDAEAFDPLHVPLEDIPAFAFSETATNEDLEALISIRNGDDPDGRSLDVLERLEDLGWASQDPSGTIALTPVGRELLRHRVA